MTQNSVCWWQSNFTTTALLYISYRYAIKLMLFVIVIFMLIKKNTVRTGKNWMVPFREDIHCTTTHHAMQDNVHWRYPVPLLILTSFSTTPRAPQILVVPYPHRGRVGGMGGADGITLGPPASAGLTGGWIYSRSQRHYLKWSHVSRTSMCIYR